MTRRKPLAEPIGYASGHYPITQMRRDQCRFACTPFDASRDAHRFCGEPTTGMNSSYCVVHRAIVYRSGSVEIDEPEAEGIAA